MSNVSCSSSDEMHEHLRRHGSVLSRPGCSCIQQYSHVPDTSAFQRYAHSPTHSRSTEKATTSNQRSDKYRRSFTTYDGITSRTPGRQSVAVSCKNDDFQRPNDNMVRKHRQKSSEIGDYKLMDTVHYLAQGEFAPRDDGIKLTPSREAVLSDIIWEDVCRTHWPTARIGRRRNSGETSRRSELQRLIDDLLRERVAHVERRRRRHYRSKINARQEHAKAAGKTGNIIVARNYERDAQKQNQNASADIITFTKHKHGSYRRNHKSHERLHYQESGHASRRGNSTSPGTVSPSGSSITSVKQTCRCQAVPHEDNSKRTKEIFVGHIDSCSTSTSEHYVKRRDTQRKQKETGTKQYVLLSTILVHDPNSRRKKMDVIERYHHVINVDNSRSDEDEEVIERVSDSCQLADLSQHSSNNLESVDGYSYESEDYIM